jgi:hypothetical protein
MDDTTSNTSTYHDYFLRCIEADKPLLDALAVKLGMRTETVAEDGTKTLASVDCEWDEVGRILVPTGRTIQVEEGGVMVERDEMAPKADAQGNIYYHANLRTRLSLGDIAAARYAETKDDALGSALQSMGRFFVVGEDGRPVRPKAPTVVFL